MTDRASAQPALRRRRAVSAAFAAAALLGISMFGLGLQSPASAQPMAQPMPAPAAPAPPPTAPPRAVVPAPSGPVDVAGTIHVCSSCHGPGGRSINTANFPNLAGQQKDYLVTQLRAMRDRTRADPHAKTYMWGMAARLSDAVIDGIADYYSRQPPAPGTPSDPRLAAAGRAIYEQGLPAQSVPPCASCHGARGEGNSAIPRLAGQHPEYIARELAEFASTARANEVMHENAKNLTPDQIRDLAAFVSSL